MRACVSHIISHNRKPQRRSKKKEKAKKIIRNSAEQQINSNNKKLPRREKKSSVAATSTSPSTFCRLCFAVLFEIPSFHICSPPATTLLPISPVVKILVVSVSVACSVYLQQFFSYMRFLKSSCIFLSSSSWSLQCVINFA